MAITRDTILLGTLDGSVGYFCTERASPDLNVDLLTAAAIGSPEQVTPSFLTSPHSNTIRCLSVLSEAEPTLFFTGGEDGFACVWSLVYGADGLVECTILWQRTYHDAIVSVAHLTAADESVQMAIGLYQPTIYATTADPWSSQLDVSEVAVTDSKAHPKAVTALLFLSSQLLCSGGADGSVCLWTSLSIPTSSPPSWSLVGVFSRHRHIISHLQRLPDKESWFASGSADFSVCFWNASSTRLENVHACIRHSSPLVAMNILRVESEMVVITADRKGWLYRTVLRLEDPKEGKAFENIIVGPEQRSAQIHTGVLSSVALVAGHQMPLLLSSGTDGRLVVTDTDLHIKELCSIDRPLTQCGLLRSGGLAIIEKASLTCKVLAVLA